MKKTILVTILVAVMLLAAISSVYAAEVKVSDTTVKKGEEVTVTVKANEARTGIQFTVSYDKSEFEYVDGSASAGSLNIEEDVEGTGVVMAYSMGSATTDTVTLKFKALKDVDAAKISVSNFVSGDEQVANVGTVTVKVETPAEEPGDNNTEEPGDNNTEEPGDNNTEKPGNNNNNPTDINGKPINKHPQTGTPLYIGAIAVIVMALGTMFVVKKSK